ncbi:NADH dehydrogenase [Mycobacterium sp. 1164966.3]|uniref:complex I subunit 5 family protein n=1 Tax=Mycobacterium sp. 1164966.3 TaxID=1856861 RepID=UPI0008016ED7|nr:proton-conducting transporter membrane subunit [Mycobacterium sp. 1164966.3]OBA80197.1 NADH dehydrogenase [Mycobacterium sp. 1164966.3]
MTAAQLLPLPVVLPLAGAVLAPLAARRAARAPLLVAVLVLSASLTLLLVVGAQVFAGSGRLLTHFLSNEHPVGQTVLGIALVADPFGVTFALLATGVGILLVVSALSELGHLGPKELGGLAGLMQLLLAALVGAALTADTVNLFVWFEVAALASYGLTGFFLERPIALEAAFKNLVLTSIAGFAVFVGSAMLYAMTGALNFGQLHHAMVSGTSRATLLAVAFLVAGFATKAGLVPFHAWLPDAHTPVPGAVSALFSALMVDLGVIALGRVALQVFTSVRPLPVLLMGLGLASALLGSAMALVQDDLKRLLAWDTVSQTGVLVAGFAARTADSVAGAVYHLVNHGLFKALMFLCAGAIVHSTGVTKLADMGGLARRRPLLTAAFTVGVLSIAGLPPFNGYASLGLIHGGLSGQPILGAALLAQVLTVAALGRAAYLGFYRRRTEAYERFEPIRAGMKVSLAVLSAGCVAFGALAGPFVAHVAGPAAAGLLDPAGYPAAALGAPVSLPRAGVSFAYVDPHTLGLFAGELVLGLAVLVLAVRTDSVSRLLGRLRRLHTGNVNDYAAFLTGGMVVVCLVLLQFG